jgi:hypothetical protein
MNCTRFGGGTPPIETGRERRALLDCAIRDTLDPRYAFHPENEAFDAQPGDEGDVVLRAWSAKKTAAKLKQEADRAARHVEALANAATHET